MYNNDSKNFLPASIIMAGLLVAGAIIYTSGSKPPTRERAALTYERQTASLEKTGSQSSSQESNIQNPSRNEVDSIRSSASNEAGAVLALGGRDAVLGSPEAPVAIIEYGDFQCAMCWRFFLDTLPKIKKEYIQTNKAKLVYRNFAFYGPESFIAAEAVECAKDQNKFWQYHDKLFEAEIADGKGNNGSITRNSLIKIAEEAGLNLQNFTACIDSKKYSGAVKAETEAASRIGVNGTPMTFINGELVRGAQSYETFKAVIEKHLK